MGHHPEICDSAGNAPPETLAFASSERPIALQAGLSPPTLACKTEPLKLETEHSLQRRSGTSPPASIPSRRKIIVILILALDAMALHQGGYFMATAPPRQRLECGDFSTAPLRAHVSANLLAWRADKSGGERAALHTLRDHHATTRQSSTSIAKNIKNPRNITFYTLKQP